MTPPERKFLYSLQCVVTVTSRGQVRRRFTTGPGIVPPIKEDLYETLVATINPHGQAGQEPGDPNGIDFPNTYWDTIKPGNVVLAQESLISGWYEAVVVGRSGDKVTLRARDYPNYPKFTVPVMAVALMAPVGS